MNYKEMYEIEKSSHLETKMELKKLQNVYDELFEKTFDYEKYDEAMSTIIQVHTNHLNHRCILQFTEEQVQKLSSKLVEDHKFGTEINRFFQQGIEEHRERFNI